MRVDRTWEGGGDSGKGGGWGGDWDRVEARVDWGEMAAYTFVSASDGGV